MSSKEDKSVQFSEFAGQFTNHVNNTDKLRGESLQRLQRIRQGRQQSQHRQLQRLVVRYGEKHPRVLRQAERVAAEKEMSSYLSVIIDKSDNETEVIDNAYTLSGHVLADTIKGLPTLGVQLQDNRGRLIGKPTKTDRQGFYKLVVDIDAGAKPIKAVLVVLDKEGGEIHREKTIVQATANVVEIRDVVIKRIKRVLRDRPGSVGNPLSDSSEKPASGKKPVSGVSSSKAGSKKKSSSGRKKSSSAVLKKKSSRKKSE